MPPIKKRAADGRVMFKVQGENGRTAKALVKKPNSKKKLWWTFEKNFSPTDWLLLSQDFRQCIGRKPIAKVTGTKGLKGGIKLLHRSTVAQRSHTSDPSLEKSRNSRLYARLMKNRDASHLENQSLAATMIATIEDSRCIRLGAALQHKPPTSMDAFKKFMKKRYKGELWTMPIGFCTGITYYKATPERLMQLATQCYKALLKKGIEKNGRKELPTDATTLDEVTKFVTNKDLLRVHVGLSYMKCKLYQPGKGRDSNVLTSGKLGANSTSWQATFGTTPVNRTNLNLQRKRAHAKHRLKFSLTKYGKKVHGTETAWRKSRACPASLCVWSCSPSGVKKCDF
jgi:hypothetical protein